MPKNKSRVLIADDEDVVLRCIKTILQNSKYIVDVVSTGEAALEALTTNEYEAMLVDLTLGDVDGLRILDMMNEQDILTQPIIITGQASVSTAVEAMKRGAFDYLAKPIETERLRATVLKAIEHYALVASNRQLRKRLQTLTRYDEIIGQSAQMMQIYKLIEVVANSTANVIVTGESGTGKELVARAIHRKGNRKNGPFIAINCSAFPTEILENELFGHEEGAFTGALKEKHGCFELAHNGTLFLDEVCEMPLETQAKLLRALEERRFRRLGGKQEIEVDVRLISASNIKLEAALKKGKLREDIYYRLSVVEIELPPLRERPGDINLLLHEFLEMFSIRNNKATLSLSAEAVGLLNNYSWPGNVRELKNTIERAVVLCDDGAIVPRHLPVRITSNNGRPDVTIPVGTRLEEVERKMIFQTLEYTNNNKTRAAKTLGISLKTLHNKLNLYKSQGKKIAHV